jgi:predicted RNA-binding protein YlqC (UPF0109 family)
MSDAEDVDAEDVNADVNEVDDEPEGGAEPVDVNEIDANTITAATAHSVLELLVTSLVDDPEAVRIDSEERRGNVKLVVRVGPDDMGRVIGRRGRVANSIRTVVRAAAVKDGVDVDVDFED